jgi:hypothetical protein
MYLSSQLLQKEAKIGGLQFKPAWAKSKTLSPK